MNRNSNIGSGVPQLESSRSQLNNMGPPNDHCHHAVDGLRLYFTGEFTNSKLIDQLEDRKRLADSERKPVSFFISEDRILVKNHEYWGKGSNILNLVMKYRGIEVAINTKTRKEGQKKLEILLRGEILTQSGLQTCNLFIKNFLKLIEFEVETIQLSEIHLAVDVPYSTDEICRLIADGHKVSRTIDSIWRQHYDKWCGFALGKRHVKHMRIYNKALELNMNPEKEEDYLKFVSNGELREDLTRVEFEIGRAAIREHGLGKWEDFLKSAPEILEYLVTDFFRIQEKPVGRNNTARGKKKLHPIWESVVHGFRALGKELKVDGDSVFHKVQRAKDTWDCSETRTRKQISGLLSSLFCKYKVMPTEDECARYWVELAAETRRKAQEKMILSTGMSYTEFHQLPEKALEEFQEFSRKLQPHFSWNGVVEDGTKKYDGYYDREFSHEARN